MHASAAFIFAIAGFAAAQTAPSGCGESIDLIIESCLGTTQAQFDACTPNDWDCLCEQANNVLTCYNNCPSAPDRFGFEQTKVANCNAASAYGSSSASRTATGTSSTATSNVAASNSATSTPSSTTDDEESSTSSTRTGTAASATATKDSGAASVAVPAGLAAMFGLVAFL
ncbi:hypothetical protein Slin15195_G119000 [Septoria linicola]|uniref:GPI anchored serine-threonine rich protein n=1 Tax=Septoria linicola TaxID=215465 RepID=A0A9Q9B7N2_9PEZI|nr:hypothetical protein Slin15195_G119000 [Septoria linicola]